MRNEDTWKPTKYAVKNGKLKGTSDRKRLGVSSRLVAQLVADAYGKYIPQYCHGDLADIGCGFVPMYEYYKPYVSSVTTIDWAESFHANEHLDIIANLNTVPIPGVADQSFDTIIFSDVLEHIYEPRSLLKELNRVMRPGAVLLMNVPFYYWVHEAPHDYHRYTEYSLKRYLDEAGFDVIEIKPLGGYGACAIDLLSKGLCMIGGGSKLATIRGLAKLFVRVPCHLAVAIIQNIVCMLRNMPLVHCLLQAKNRAFPVGYFVVAKARKN